MRIYKCYYDDGSYSLRFSDDGESFYSYSYRDGSSYYVDYFSKVEPLETGDTLQEVVDSLEEREALTFYYGGEMCITKNHSSTYFKDIQELLNHIRQPKHTPEELEVLELAKKLNVKIELKTIHGNN